MFLVIYARQQAGGEPEGSVVHTPLPAPLEQTVSGHSALKRSSSRPLHVSFLTLGWGYLLRLTSSDCILDTILVHHRCF